MAKKQSVWSKVGVWSFVIGLIIVLVISLITPSTGYSRTLAIILGILGIIIGLLNIGDKEVTLYLISTLALLLGANSLATISEFLRISSFVTTFMQGIMILAAPGAVIVALRALYDVAKS